MEIKIFADNIDAKIDQTGKALSNQNGVNLRLAPFFDFGSTKKKG